MELDFSSATIGIELARMLRLLLDTEVFELFGVIVVGFGSFGEMSELGISLFYTLFRVIGTANGF